eukprot:TRINITY_DN4020_c0_g1_i2.p3 TRINITY_DN4020_c0_g1~~TRINITY_DN4020_c0_g1_i2.p3  ORF type:complete len:150 (-),score=34.65 TRINITY_DN4020_c0_g1_i2:91-540(-)
MVAENAQEMEDWVDAIGNARFYLNNGRTMAALPTLPGQQDVSVSLDSSEIAATAPDVAVRPLSMSLGSEGGSIGCGVPLPVLAEKPPAATSPHSPDTRSRRLTMGSSRSQAVAVPCIPTPAASPSPSPSTTARMGAARLAAVKQPQPGT